MYEKTLSQKTIYKGRILSLELQDVQLDNGATSRREIVRHRPAAAVLARLPSGDFMLVRQFRKAVERIVLEVIAGICDDDEASIDCARREVTEETGHDVTMIRQLGSMLPTPGYVDERIDIFYAELSNERGDDSLDHDEFVEPVVLKKSELEKLMVTGKIEDAKTLVAWMLYEKGAGDV
ncbi:MAG: NUDIX hydrolase [Verrucomicrobia bacterium]|nr:NUDIX hydrolase [Verrucomicrobiota bacterium]